MWKLLKFNHLRPKKKNTKQYFWGTAGFWRGIHVLKSILAIILKGHPTFFYQRYSRY